MRSTHIMAMVLVGGLACSMAAQADSFDTLGSPTAAEYSDKYMARSMMLMKEESSGPNRIKEGPMLPVKPGAWADRKAAGKRMCPPLEVLENNPKRQIMPVPCRLPPPPPPRAVIHLPKWTLRDNETMRQNIERWGKRAGFHVMWRAHDWVPMQTSQFKGSFKEVIHDFVKAVSMQGGEVRAGFYSNHLLIITGSGVKQ